MEVICYILRQNRVRTKIVLAICNKYTFLTLRTQVSNFTHSLSFIFPYLSLSPHRISLSFCLSRVFPHNLFLYLNISLSRILVTLPFCFSPSSLALSVPYILLIISNSSVTSEDKLVYFTGLLKSRTTAEQEELYIEILDVKEQEFQASK